MSMFTSTALRATVALVGALAAAAASAQTQTLDFSGAACANTMGDWAELRSCFNGFHISQSYGDIPGVLDVSHRSVVTPFGQTAESALRFWDSGYSNLERVAYAVGNGSQEGEIRFIPAVGHRVTLNSIAFGAYLGYGELTTARVFNFDNQVNWGTVLQGVQVLWNSRRFNPPVDAATVFSPDVTSDTGLVLRWGPTPGNPNIGIDNIVVTVSPVPEPHEWAMMLAGLGLVGAVARRRREPKRAGAPTDSGAAVAIA